MSSLMPPCRALLLLTFTVLSFMLPFTISAATSESPVTDFDPRKTILLDDFKDLSGWSAVTSSGARLEIAQDTGRNGGRAMRLDFEATDGASWIIARKTFNLRLPKNYLFRAYTRGETPPVDFEFKLVAPQENVWWHKQRDYRFADDWQPLTVKKRHLSLAWGPGGPLEEAVAIEIAVVPGGQAKGSIWIDQLTLEEREPAELYLKNPTLSASTTAEGFPAAGILDPDQITEGWHSGALAEDQWLLMDFQTVREYGGLVVDWNADDYAVDYQVQASDDGDAWKTLYTVRGGNGRRDYLYLPDAESRYLRLTLERSSRGRGYGIRRLQVQSYEFSTSINRFFEAVARDVRRGLYPRYLQGEQSYWTLIGVSGDSKEALMNQDGALEVDKGGFSIEPFLFADGQLLSWADVNPVQELADGYLPIPTVRWERDQIGFTVTAFASGKPGQSELHARYRLENRSGQNRHLTLFLAVRPFQVNPPWQSLNMMGGVSPIRRLEYADRAIWVNDRSKVVFALTAPDRFSAAAFDHGLITDFLLDDKLPERTAVDDPLGHASGVLEYGWDFKPGEAREVFLRVPFHGTESLGALPPTDADAAVLENQLLAKAQSDWETRLDRVKLELPPSGKKLADSIKSNLAYILINRNGPAIQPGSRTYARSWIRDGALTSAALLSMGYTDEVRQFLLWFTPYQQPDGKVPCCVDQRGADPVPEHDSHGQLIYAIMEYYRYTRDVGFLREMWPFVVKAVDYIDFLRQQRLTDAYRTDPTNIAYLGLVPESISHEGYSSHPRHSYWDNFFILRGLKDAADIAVILGEDQPAQRFASLRDAFRKDLYASIRATLKTHQIDFIPGAVELGDFDPTSTTVAVDPGGELGRLPQPALDRTFERYFDQFRQRRDGQEDWQAYTPYELRAVGTLIRLGFREKAQEALAFFFEGQRPAAWNHWAEVVWRDPKAPRFIGDMPHTWVGSDFIRSARSLFAYEREADQALVIGAGIPAAWATSPEGVAVKRLPTWHGTLNYRMGMDGPDLLRVQLSGDITVPPGRIILHSPLDRPLQAVQLNGRPVTTFTDHTATLDQFPAEVEFHYGAKAAVR
ncbi:MAG TPA: discoidin domain-containing protein [Candidatus Competibacter sp.]|nr:discoidin domain-containing protein [Candidatus Competibacter sp.]HUM96076.1 discoidin domain-containing protein [Candidatus Competibacter sp.]